jgi:hypothetical protein
MATLPNAKASPRPSSCQSAESPVCSQVGELKTALAKSSTAGVLSDAAVGELERRVTAVVGDVTSVDFVQFCRISMADLEEAAAACVDE